MTTITFSEWGLIISLFLCILGIVTILGLVGALVVSILPKKKKHSVTITLSPTELGFLRGMLNERMKSDKHNLYTMNGIWGKVTNGKDSFKE